MRKVLPFTFFWPFSQLPDRLRGSALNDFAQAGAEGVVLTDGILSETLSSPAAIVNWRRMVADAGLRFIDAHSPFGPLSDLACPVPEAVPQMLSMHRRCIAICAEFGVKSITIHVGRPTSFSNDTEALFANILRSTEALLPAAEEAGVVICIENIWDAVNTADRLIRVVDTFRSPWLGVCWDSGHAQLTRSEAPNVPEQACRASWRNCGYDEPEHGDDYLRKLLPHIVTCHLHTNDRMSDRHWLPTDPRGLTDWASELPQLFSAPRLMQMQSEASVRAENPFTPRDEVESLRALTERFAP